MLITYVLRWQSHAVAPVIFEQVSQDQVSSDLTENWRGVKVFVISHFVQWMVAHSHSLSVLPFKKSSPKNCHRKGAKHLLMILRMCVDGIMMLQMSVSCFTNCTICLCPHLVTKKINTLIQQQTFCHHYLLVLLRHFAFTTLSKLQLRSNQVYSAVS